MSPQFVAALPFGILAGLALAITAEIVAAVRRGRRPSAPEDGCCGCGGALANVFLKCGETYCWTCVDRWSAQAPPLAELGMQAFPGHERSAR